MSKKKKLDFVKIEIDKTKSIPLSTFLRSMGMSSKTMVSLFGDTSLVNETIKKDNSVTEDDALVNIHGILKKGDRITEESKKNLYANLLFNARRYDLSKTGRYTLNRKLNLIDRIENTILAEELVSKDGKVLYEAGTAIDFKLAVEIQEAFSKGILPLIEVPEISATLYGQQLEKFPNLQNGIKVASVQV